MKFFNAVIIDDHKIFAESFGGLLKAIGKFNIVSHFHSVDYAKEEMLVQHYDFLFTDILMPGFDALHFIAFARKKWPNILIVVISSVNDTQLIKEAFGAGANAFLSKSVGSDELNLAIERTWHGESYISSDMAGRLANAMFFEEKKRLTKRETEILKYVSNGYSISETAIAMHLSEYTVITHRRNIMKKLGVNSAVEMAKYAYDNKLF